MSKQADTSRFSIDVRGPFSLEAARELQCGFLRGSRTCAAGGDSVRMAFPRDGSFDVVGSSSFSRTRPRSVTTQDCVPSRRTATGRSAEMTILAVCGNARS